MARGKWPVRVVFALALGLLGNDSDCFKPFAVEAVIDGGLIDDPDARCAPLDSPFPPDLDFDPLGAKLWAVDYSPLPLVPFSVDVAPPTLVAGAAFLLPLDRDGDGDDDGTVIESIEFLEVDLPGIDPTLLTLALLTATGLEEVLLFDAGTTALYPFDASVPVVVVPAGGLAFPVYPHLPAPGATPAPRTGLSTVACLDSPAAARDSHDAPITGEAGCVSGFFTSLPSAAAIGGNLGAPIPAPKLFVAVENRGASELGDPDPQYLPGAVLVFDISLVDGRLRLSPSATTPVIYTSGFNPIDVVPYTTSGGRNFILVAVAGAIGANPDLITTPVVEGGYTPLTGAAIDVIDAETLELVATIPLGLAGLTGKLRVHPTAPIAAIGSKIDRWVLAVDLAVLATAAVPATTPAAGPVILDGSVGAGPDAVLHDAEDPLEITHAASGANAATCPGYTAGVAFNAVGGVLYATEFCDGTLGVFGVDTLAVPPLSPFTVQDPIKLSAAIDTTAVGMPRGPGALAFRTEAPTGVEIGPELFVLFGKPAGLLCALEIEPETAL